MKTTGLLCIGAALLLATTASAAEPHGLGHWKGDGVRFDAKHKPVGSFSIELDRTPTADGAVMTAGKVTLSDGKAVAFSQKLIGDENGFRLESDHGKGGGVCYGAGLCQAYEDEGGGHARATTIVLDGDDRIRVLTTELEHGQPLSFTRQTMSRQ